jgi:non-heme chloroperoxidase
MYPPPSTRTAAIVRYLSNEGVSLALETRGSGPRRILFVHGWISSRRMFYDVCNHLDPSLYTMQLLDFRGAGLSDRPATGYDLEGYASDLRTAIVEAGGPVEIVAHSMGARIAQFVALDPPENLTRLTLVAPGTAKMGRVTDPRRALSEAAFGSRLGIERFQRAAMIRDIPPDAMERLIDDALITSREGWFEWLDRGRIHDFSDRLGSITLPVLVVIGDRDPLVPAARLRRDVVAPIDGALVTVLRNVGHNIPVETPLELAAIVHQFAAKRAQAG